MAPLERPLLADRPPPRPPTPPGERADFRRRLSYYLTGVVIGAILVIPLLSAKCAQRNAASQQQGGPAGPGSPVQPAP
jgi:hypothetical protein